MKLRCYGLAREKGAAKARSVTARRDEGGKNLQSHSGLCSQSIPRETEIQLLLSLHLTLSPVFTFPSSTSYYIFVPTRLHPYVSNLLQKIIIIFFYSHSSSSVFIQSLIPCIDLCRVLQLPLCLSSVMKLNKQLYWQNHIISWGLRRN